MPIARKRLCFQIILLMRFTFRRKILCGGRIVVGYYKYYHTGLYYPQDALGQSMTIRVQATNAMSPWNTISRSRVFTLPMV